MLQPSNPATSQLNFLNDRFSMTAILTAANRVFKRAWISIEPETSLMPGRETFKIQLNAETETGECVIAASLFKDEVLMPTMKVGGYKSEWKHWSAFRDSLLSDVRLISANTSPSTASPTSPLKNVSSSTSSADSSKTAESSSTSPASAQLVVTPSSPATKPQAVFASTTPPSSTKQHP